MNYLNLILFFLFSNNFFGSAIQEKYVCMPCGAACDEKEYDKPGDCASCNMDLVKKSAVQFKTITVSELCSFIKKNAGLVILDVRTKDEFQGISEPRLGRLKNAINIPIQEMGQRMSELNVYKAKTILVYCSHSVRSPQVSVMLTGNGFKNVVNLAGGISQLTDKSCVVQ